MNANSLLNMLLSAGQSMAQQGRDVAEDKLNIPAEGSERNAMLSGMGKGAIAAGAVALLLGTKTGRNVTGGALKVGSLAALGGLAYKAYQQWQSGKDDHVTQQPQNQAIEPQALEQLSDNDLDVRSKKLLQAVIAAAKADGHIDDNERGVINEFIEKLGESAELTAFIQSELEKPLDPTEIAADTQTAGLAAEVYLMSRIIINDANFMEKAYLGELAKALQLDSDLVLQLDEQALAAA